MHGFHKQVGGNLWCVECCKWLHDNHVHLAILHGGAWGNVSIITILRGVGAGNQECLVLLGTRIVAHLVGLGFVFQSLFQHVLYVGDGTALACFGKLQ